MNNDRFGPFLCEQEVGRPAATTGRSARLDKGDRALPAAEQPEKAQRRAEITRALSSIPATVETSEAQSVALTMLAGLMEIPKEAEDLMVQVHYQLAQVLPFDQYKALPEWVRGK